jgi:type VI secretion system protein ImpA
MPLRDDLLNPIPGDNPSGADVRYDTKLLLYDKIKEARRADDALAQGDWQHERKLADYPQVIKLAQEALATRTKDLQLAAWLTEALLHTEGFAGLRDGLTLCNGLIRTFWETLYPPVEDGDLDLRAGTLEWLANATEIPLKSRPLVKSGYDWLKYKESRTVGYDDPAKSDKERKGREQKLAEGKLSPEDFDKAFSETPKTFYSQSEKDLDGAISALKNLEQTADEKFGNAGPSFGKLKTALEEVRHTVHTLLEKKRETEPDPTENETAASLGESAQSTAAGPVAAADAPGITISVLTSSEPVDRREAIAAVAKAAALLRKLQPYSPAPYLMLRGLRWGELRAAVQSSELTELEAPPTELRQHIKRLALAKKWAELSEACENAMSLPCSRGWLDLQRFVVMACAALGEEYALISSAIQSELRTLLTDLPQLLDATLLDDTPAANAETRAWLVQLLPPASSPSLPSTENEPSVQASANGHRSAAAWLANSSDAYSQAQEALKASQPEKAFEIMRREIAHQRSGRGRFERTLQLVELCTAAGKDEIAQPLLDDLIESIESHKLDSWEDPQMMARALATVMKISKKVQGDNSERQKLFERICRLDPVRALSTG